MVVRKREKTTERGRDKPSWNPDIDTFNQLLTFVHQITKMMPEKDHFI